MTQRATKRTRGATTLADNQGTSPERGRPRHLPAHPLPLGREREHPWAGVPGFTDYGIDSVIKFGGSLLRDLERCEALLRSLTELVRQGQRFLVVPGGGPTDKTIEAINQQRALQMGVCHRACALAQDQTGLLISGLSFSDGLIPCETLEQAQDALEGQRVPILLPSRIIFDLNPIEKTWDVTSDAVAAWFAWLVHATWLVILTDVDGIYYPPNMVGSQDHLLPEVSPERVREIGVSSVDACVPALLTQARLDCVILNGWRPNRLKDWFAGRPTIGTSIRTAQ